MVLASARSIISRAPSVASTCPAPTVIAAAAPPPSSTALRTSPRWSEQPWRLSPENRGYGRVEHHEALTLPLSTGSVYGPPPAELLPESSFSQSPVTRQGTAGDR
jgi:hypothetical protein